MNIVEKIKSELDKVKKVNEERALLEKRKQEIRDSQFKYATEILDKTVAALELFHFKKVENILYCKGKWICRISISWRTWENYNDECDKKEDSYVICWEEHSGKEMMSSPYYFEETFARWLVSNGHVIA